MPRTYYAVGILSSIFEIPSYVPVCNGYNYDLLINIRLRYSVGPPVTAHSYARNTFGIINVMRPWKIISFEHKERIGIVRLLSSGRREGFINVRGV